MTYLDCANVGVLCCILVLVESIFGQFALLEVDTELDKLEHHGLQRGDGTTLGSLGCDMFV